MTLTKAKLTTTRTQTRLAAICAWLAVGLVITAAAQSTPDFSPAEFHFDATNPSPLIHVERESLSQVDDRRCALPLDQEFSHSSYARLLETSQADKSWGLSAIDAGYGEFFTEQNRFLPSTSAGIETPSWLYLKVSFSF